MIKCPGEKSNLRKEGLILVYSVRENIIMAGKNASWITAGWIVGLSCHSALAIQKQENTGSGPSSHTSNPTLSDILPPSRFYVKKTGDQVFKHMYPKYGYTPYSATTVNQIPNT